MIQAVGRVARRAARRGEREPIANVVVGEALIADGERGVGRTGHLAFGVVGEDIGAGGAKGRAGVGSLGALAKVVHGVGVVGDHGGANLVFHRGDHVAVGFISIRYGVDRRCRR